MLSYLVLDCLSHSILSSPFPVLVSHSGQSLLVDVNHAEGCRLIWLALVLDGEDHNFVAWEAVSLLLCDLQYKRNKLLHMLIYNKTKYRLNNESKFLILTKVAWNFIAENTSGAVDLSDHMWKLWACEHDLLWLLADEIPGHAACRGKADE